MSATHRESPGPVRYGRGSQLLILFALLAVITVNALANALPLNGLTTGEVARRFDELFRPAGYVFAIWSLIYAGLLAYGGFQSLPAQRENPRLAAIRAPFLGSCAANVAWILSWHHLRFTASLLAIGVLLASLVVLERRLRDSPGTPSHAEVWCVEAPFRVYLAWVTVATIANFSIWVEALGLLPAGLPPEIWAIALIALTTMISARVGSRRHDALYLAVVVWAFAGIAVRNGWPSPVSATALAAIGVILVILVRALWWNRSHGARPPFHRAGTAT